MTQVSRTDALARAAHIRLMMFDVDGILTDGRLQYGPHGEALKTFNVLDGLGIKLLRQSGITVAIITARSSDIVARRAADLGIDHVLQGVHDKKSVFEQLLQNGLQDKALQAHECGFIGDDLIDLPVLSRGGFGASVPNAHAEVRSRVHYVTQAAGGNGAVRELCDFILQAQGNYEASLTPYLA